MFEILKQHLKENYYWNQLYFGLTIEEKKNLRELLQLDYGNVDFVLDFSDFSKLESLIHSIPKTGPREFAMHIIYEYYTCYKILSQINLPDYLKHSNVTSLEEVEKILFSGTFLELLEKVRFNFEFLSRDISEEAKKKNKKARMHIFMDELPNASFQIWINTLIASRLPITIMGYSTKEELPTYQTYFEGQIIECPHDYSEFCTEEHYQRLRKKYGFPDEYSSTKS